MSTSIHWPAARFGLVADLVSSETRALAPEEARRLLAENTYIGQRPLKKTRLQLLKTKMDDGVLRKGEVVLCENGQDQSRTVMNGQHFLTMLSEAEHAALATIDVYHVADDGDRARLFAEFDNVSARSGSDIMQAYEASRFGYNLPIQEMLLVANALGMLKWGPSFSSLSSKVDRVELLTGKEDEAKMVYRLFYDAGMSSPKLAKVVRPFRRIPVIAAVLATCKAAPRVGIRWWEEVRDGVDRGGPREVLRTFLRQTSQYTNPARRGMPKKRVTLGELYSICVNAWNADRRGGTIAPFNPENPMPKPVS